jgi:DNA-directed RNA polymerase alpha subunit
MPAVQVSIRLSDELWRAVQALASQEGDANTVILRALEEYVIAVHKRGGHRRKGKYRRLVEALGTPVAAITWSSRAMTGLRALNIRYMHELVQMSPSDLLRLRNFGVKSLNEIKETLYTYGLKLGMTLDEGSYRAAIAETVLARIRAEEK